MLIFLAGLRNIPTSLYEAAEIDGANSWQQARRSWPPICGMARVRSLAVC